mgnify:CR=1 FL=1
MRIIFQGKNKYTTAGHTIYKTINTVMKGNINMSVVSFNKDYLENVKNSGKIILLDFYADWCGPCRMLSPVVDEFAEENPDFVVGKINVDKKVYLIHRRDKLRATKIYYEALLKAENIEIVWNSMVVELLADERVNGIKIKNVTDGVLKVLSCDGVFISIGRKPASDFLKKAVDIDENGYVVADESTKTNVEGVYAVGDVRTKAFRQVVTAVSDGAVAVYYAENYINKF